jgi:plasmid stabilization system protein ParE
VNRRRVRFLGAARAELSEVVEFYDGRVPSLGNDFAAVVQHTIQQIGQHPDRGASYLGGTRRVLLKRFPFSIVYQDVGDEVVVVAIAHQRRKPGYWLRRL